MTILGEGWYTPPPVVEHDEQWHHEPELSVDDLRYEQLMVAMAALKDALVNMPAPQVSVAAPDLAAIVTAVNGLKGNASPDDIARAVVNQITPGGEPQMDEVLNKLVKALEKLDFRMQGGMGGGGVAPVQVKVDPDVTDRGSRELGLVTVKNPGLTESQLRAAPVSTIEAHRTVPTEATLQALDSAIYLQLNPDDDISAFSFHILGHTTGEFRIERTLTAIPAGGPEAIPASDWTAVGAFRAGTRTSRSTWTDQPGAFHGNASASTALRIRVTIALNVPARARLLAGGGTGTITIGAIASNEGNIIGSVADLEQQYASSEGGYALFNATTGLMAAIAAGASANVMLFENPTGSGRDIRLFRITTAATLRATAWERFRNSTITVRGTASTNVNRGGGTNTSVARMYASGQFTVTAVGSTSETHTLPANGTDRDAIRGGIRLKPGESAMLRVTNLDAALGGTTQPAVHLVWADLPAVTP